ncbi:MAG: hypothetical protein ACP5H8_01025 [Candidatus Micrarchaeia archaeon]
MVYEKEQLKNELSSLHSYVRSRNIRKLRELNNTFTHNLLIYQDKLYLDLAVLSILLAKLIEKPRFWKFEKWKEVLFGIEDTLLQCLPLCDVYDKKGIQRNLKKILSVITIVDEQDRRYVDSLIDQAKVKIGSSLYAQGMSIGKASFLSEVSKEKIMSYSGKTLISDRFGKTYSIKERINNVRGVFGD